MDYLGEIASDLFIVLNIAYPNLSFNEFTL